MTYRPTLGLTQDFPLIGNFASLRWGLIGTFIKGSIWIGFFGLFFGIGLSGKKYSLFDILLILFVSIFFLYLGLFILNEPFDPINKKHKILKFMHSGEKKLKQIKKEKFYITLGDLDGDKPVRL